MLMMGTCSRQRSLSMKYFNKKHTKQRRWLLLKSSHYSETKPVYLDFLILQDSEYLSPSILIFKSEIELSTSVFTVDETQCYTSIQMAWHSAYKCFSPRHLNTASIASDNYVIFSVFHLSLEKYSDIFITKYKISRKSFKVFLQHSYTLIIVGPEFHEDHEDRL